MPKAILVTSHGLNFEDTVKRLIATPPMPKAKKAKRASSKKPKFGKN